MADKFIEMRDIIHDFLDKMMKDNKRLFLINLDKDKLYQTYLDSMSPELNPFFRKTTTHDCSCCRGFIKNVGAVIAIKNCKVTTVWDANVRGTGYEKVFEAMNHYVRSHVNDIEGFYVAALELQGCHHNFEVLEDGKQLTWPHFYIKLRDNCWMRDSVARNALVGDASTDYGVFKRGLEELTLDALDSILELIASNSLYKGAEYKNQIQEFRKCKVQYDKIETELEKKFYVWEQVANLSKAILRLKNTSIGTLLYDVSIGVDLDRAVTAYEKMVAPENYKRPKAIYTKSMLENAMKKIEELGVKDALPRRHAKISDLTVNDTLFVDRSIRSQMKGEEVDELFSQLGKEATKKTLDFSRVEEIKPEDFVKNILPTATKLEVYLDNSHKGNFVSLIAPKNECAKSIFQWGNNFTWAYAGNVTDSMEERVKAAGGNINGILRFSIQWNECGTDNCDLDAHCYIEAIKEEIYYGHKMSTATNGRLDVDIICPEGKIAVENIYWENTSRLPKGDYKFFVHQYSGSVKEGFRAQIKMAGQLFEFNYPKGMRSGEKVQVATVHWDGKKFTIKPALDVGGTPVRVWGLNTLDFVPVQLVCYSPNYWETAPKNVGHKHLFFILKDCVNDEQPSGLFNEFLIKEFSEVRKVMEAITLKMRVEDTPEQLSGIGFALDKRAELIVRVTGTTVRTLKIKF